MSNLYAMPTVHQDTYNLLNVSFKVPWRSVLTLTPDPTASGWACMLSLPAVLDKCGSFLRDCLGGFYMNRGNIINSHWRNHLFREDFTDEPIT